MFSKALVAFCLAGGTLAAIEIEGNSMVIPSESSPEGAFNTRMGTFCVGGPPLRRTFTIKNTGDAVQLVNPVLTAQVWDGSSSTPTQADVDAYFNPAPELVDFFITDPLPNLADGESKEFAVSFSGDSGEGEHAEIHVSSDDPTTPDYWFAVQANSKTEAIQVESTWFAGQKIPDTLFLGTKFQGDAATLDFNVASLAGCGAVVTSIEIVDYEGEGWNVLPGSLPKEISGVASPTHAFSVDYQALTSGPTYAVIRVKTEGTAREPEFRLEMNVIGGGQAPAPTTPAPTSPNPTPATLAPTDTPVCVEDYKLGNGDEWHDAASDFYTCEWYASYPNYCEDYGTEYAYQGYTASQACCVCGGGRWSMESQRPTVAPPPAPTFQPTDAGCVDLLSPDGSPWQDAGDFDCLWYAGQSDTNQNRCATYGQQYEAWGSTAADACCVCGGGARPPSVPTLPPSVDPGTCQDYTFVEYDFKLLADKYIPDYLSGDGASLFPNAEINGCMAKCACEMRPGNLQYCCPDAQTDDDPSKGWDAFCTRDALGQQADQCSSKSESSCTNACTWNTATGTCEKLDCSALADQCGTCNGQEAPWHDAVSDAFTCEWYAASSERCALYGDKNAFQGATANEACCVCGGGSNNQAACPSNPTCADSTLTNTPFFDQSYSFYAPGPQVYAQEQGWDACQAKCVCEAGGSNDQYCCPDSANDWDGFCGRDLINKCGLSTKCNQQCGGGTDPWHDARGTSFDCAWYAADKTRCATDGEQHEFDGQTASQACCVCGGGCQDWPATAAATLATEISTNCDGTLNLRNPTGDNADNLKWVDCPDIGQDA